MAHLVSVINGKQPLGGVGGVSDADLSNIAVNFLTAGVVSSSHYLVEQQTTPDMTVKVNTGRAYVFKGDGSMAYETRLDTVVNATIGSNASGNPRKDSVVIKIDLAVAPNNFASNVASIAVVQGTPAASPLAPTDSEIQSAVGAGNPFYRLSDLDVANGAVSIISSNIYDTRALVTFTNQSINFATSGPQADFLTTSGTPVDVPGASVTINPTRTAKVMATITGNFYDTTSITKDCQLNLVIDGVLIQSNALRPPGVSARGAFAVSGQATVPAGARIIKLQILVVGGGDSLHVDAANVNVMWS